MALQIDTDHGAYDAQEYRDCDEGPARAVLTVWRDGGSVAGYVSQPWPTVYAACREDGREIGQTATPEGAVSLVADRDR
jgi:hypothetical protein